MSEEEEYTTAVKGRDACRERPYVIINSAMSIDGKISSICSDSRLSSKHDLVRVHRLRSTVDAVMVGINTVLIDDPML
ncbi:MAG: dihydrofolate reductase family protein, partial [Candidatus Nitrosocaldus sp.]